MCLMLLSSAEKKKVKSGTQTNKALLRRATTINGITSKESENKTVQEKRIKCETVFTEMLYLST